MLGWPLNTLSNLSTGQTPPFGDARILKAPSQTSPSYTLSIPDIYPFWGTTTLFRPVFVRVFPFNLLDPPKRALELKKTIKLHVFTSPG